MEEGCAILSMDEYTPGCLPFIFFSTQSAGEIRPGTRQRYRWWRHSGEKTLVPEAPFSDCEATSSASVSEVFNPTFVQTGSSKGRESASHDMAAFWERGKEAGLFQREQRIFPQSLSGPQHVVLTTQNLQSYVRQWEEFGFDSVTTLRFYRSAIGTLHSGFEDGSSVSSFQLLSRLSRFFFLQLPPVKSLLTAWSLSAGLRVLAADPPELLHKSSLLILSHFSPFLQFPKIRCGVPFGH